MYLISDFWIGKKQKHNQANYLWLRALQLTATCFSANITHTTRISLIKTSYVISAFFLNPFILYRAFSLPLSPYLYLPTTVTSPVTLNLIFVYFYTFFPLPCQVKA